MTGSPPRARDATLLERGVDRLLSLLRTPTGAVIAVTAAGLALLSYSPPADPDVFARVAVGRLVELNGGVVDQDPFAYTMRLDRWVDHEWLAGVVFYAFAKMGGDFALLALNLAFFFLTLVLVTVAQRETDGGRNWSPPWLFLAFLPAAGVWISVIRSRVVTIALRAVMLLALVRWRNGHRRLLWALPPSFVFWANTHGGFVAGLGLLGAAAAAVTLTDWRRSRELWVCLALCVVATLINPYGLAYWDYILGAVTMERPGIAEWGPLPLGSVFGVHAVLYLGIFLGGAWLAERRPPPEAWALVAVAFVASLGSRRITNFFYVILAVYGAGPAKALAARARTLLPSYWEAGRRVVGVAFAVAILLAAAQTIRNLADAHRRGLDYAEFPMGAVDWLETRGSGGRLLVHFNYGSYALWRLYPAYRVSLDGRYEETYPQVTADRVDQALQPEHPDHAKALQSVSPDYILVIDPARAAAFGPSWNTVYEDDRFAVLAHDTLALAGPARPVRPTWTPGF